MKNRKANEWSGGLWESQKQDREKDRQKDRKKRERERAVHEPICIFFTSRFPLVK